MASDTNSDPVERLRSAAQELVDAVVALTTTPIGPPQPEAVYSLKEVAQRLTLSRSEVQRLRQRGLLESIPIGRRHVVTASQLRRFLERQEGGQ